MAYNEDVNINLNILAGALGGVTAIASGMSALTSTFGQFGTTAADSFGSVEGILVSLSALIAAFGVESANAAGEFEQNMKIVQAVSGQTSGVIQQLGDQANQLSVQYRMAIDDITEGLQTLGRAGLNSADSQLEVLESGLQTAKLEGRNLNSVLEELIQNTAMLGGNLDSIDFGAQTEYVNSLMVGTSMSAPIDTHDISQTLQYVGGTAAAAGANLEDKEKLEDLMGTIAAFAQKGVTGSMAGTALRAFLTKPASQDKSVVSGLEAIGLSPEDLWEDGGESMKDISDQIELIQHQMDKLNLSTMDQLEIWGKIVGPKMGQQMMKLEADKIDELKGNIQEAASAEELATSTLNTYTQNVNQLGQTASGIFRQLGANIVMWLNPVITVLNAIASLFNNQLGGDFVFAGMLAILSRGIQAAYGMITSIIGQVKAAINDIRTGISSIAGGQDGVISGASQYDSIVKQTAADIQLMNSNLQETNTLWGQFQAVALGKNASAQIRGYGPHNPMPQSLLGITDNYTQYFRKKDMADHYEAYKFKGKIGINEGEYNALPKSSQSKFEKVGDGVTYRPKNVILSPTDYYKLPPELQSRYERTKIKEDEYNELDPYTKKKYHAVGDKYSTNVTDGDKDAYHYISQSEYQKLSAEEKKDYFGRNARLETHVGTIEEMRAAQEESLNKLRIVGDEEWAKASKEERDKIRDETNEMREKLRQELGEGEKLYKKDAKGNYIKDLEDNNIDTGYRQYQTLKNVPKPENLATLEKRAKKEWAEAIANARVSDGRSKAREKVRDSLGRGGKTRFDELRKLGQSANVATKGINTGTQSVRNSANAVRASSNGVRGGLQRLRDGLSTGYSRIMSFGNGISLTAQTVGPLTDQFRSVGQEIVSAETGLTAMRMQTMTVDEAFTTMAAKMNISEQEFAELVIASEEVSAAFAALAGTSETAVLGKAGDVLNKSTGKFTGAINEVVNQLGGSFSVAMIGATLAVQALQAAFQSYQQDLQKAQTEMSEAKQEREEYESSIKDLYSEENENLTESDLNRALLAQYGSIGTYGGGSLDQYGDANVIGDVRFVVDDDEAITSRIGDEKFVDEFSLQSEDHIKALNENTVQLAAATAAYSKAANKVQDKLTDPVYGSEGAATDITDREGIAGFLASVTGPGQLYQLLNWRDPKSIFKTGSPNLTQSQASDSYAGSTELAAIMAADAKRFGVEGGLSHAFGTDIHEIQEKLGGIESNTYQSMKGLMANAADMTPEQAAAAQVSMKENKQDYQILGKLLAKREILTGQMRQTSPLMQQNKLGLQGLRVGPKQAELKDKKGDAKEQKTAEQQLRELKSIDNGINQEVAKLIRLSNGKLTEQNIIAMSQLQQFQDMYDIAQSTIAPGILSTVQQAYNNVIATQGAGSNAGSAADGAGSAAANAAIIAQYLAQQAAAEAGKQMYQDELSKGNFLAGLVGEDAFKAMVSNDTLGKAFFQDQRKNWAEAVYIAGDRLQHPGLTSDQYKNRAEAAWSDVQGQMRQNNTGFKAALGTMSSQIKDYAEGATLAAYMNSSVGEFGKSSNPSGSGGGGGGGDGGSGNDDDSGKNKKNRVDLVLCNKKEIPKLNVNLFKKEPNFTVLNKNFKVRDIKINTQDTPKSILSAVKNGIIDTAKRMDPKIIQDGESVYDPVGATEGTDIPSGSTPPTSN